MNIKLYPANIPIVKLTTAGISKINACFPKPQFLPSSNDTEQLIITSEIATFLIRRKIKFPIITFSNFSLLKKQPRSIKAVSNINLNLPHWFQSLFYTRRKSLFLSVLVFLCPSRLGLRR